MVFMRFFSQSHLDRPPAGDFSSGRRRVTTLMGTSLGRVLPYLFLGYALRNLSG